ncbi:MAG TPA: sigma 54-interacting transcriptional regulator [Polyangia bacterium]|nr:sigma 54-interacting transcriptional regulator [Polyangia bacterium]
MSSETTVDATRRGGPDPGAGSRAYLVVRESGCAQVIHLDEGADVLVGRGEEATVRVDDAKASREHARFLRRDGALALVDLGSRNGTHLNGTLIKGGERPLRSGDVVRIGAVEILVAETAGIATPSAGMRAEAELARLLVGGEAALVRLSVTTDELAQLADALAGATLVEEQPDGDCACLFETPRAADAAAMAIRARVADGVVGVAHAPQDGETFAALWLQTDDASARPSALLPVAASAPPGVVVGDPQMARVFELVKKVAAAPTTVLVLGETGVGKEIVAEQIHQQSPRAAGPFLRLNCGSLPETLLESELYGHERGAFTGADKRKLGYLEAASGGTLFLDEIGELALPMQTRLLRVLESGRFMRVGGREEIAVDLRVVAATNRDLEAEAKAGRFRQDLYFRLSAFVIRIPRLRDRPGEIELFADLFARQLAKRMGAAPPVVAPDALALLRRHAWPGNVRELRNAMEHAVVLADAGVIRAEHLPDSLRATDAAAGLPAGPMRAQLAEIEKRSIREALDAEHGNQTRAAKRLGISRRALLYKLDKYGRQ